ncbi:hypothetical protein [Paenibacillus sp. JCM 10914]
MRTYWRPTAVVSALLLALGSGLFLLDPAREADAVVGTVNGLPLTESEFSYALHTQRGTRIVQFASEVRTDHGSSQTPSESKRTTQLDTLRQTALDEAVRIKVQLQLAHEQGLLEEPSITGIERELQMENIRRATALKSGQPVYGPVRFDKEGFTPYYLSKLRLQLIDIMPVSEMDNYESASYSRSTWIPNAPAAGTEPEVEFYELTLTYRDENPQTNGLEAKERKQAALEAMERFRLEMEPIINETSGLWDQADRADKELLEIDDLTESLGEMDGVVQRRKLDATTAREWFKSRPQLYAYVTGQRTKGDLSEVLDEPMLGQYTLVVINKEPDPQEAVPAKTDQWDKAASYDAYVEALVRKAEVTVDSEVLERILLGRGDILPGQ